MGGAVRSVGHALGGVRNIVHRLPGVRQVSGLANRLPLVGRVTGLAHRIDPLGRALGLGGAIGGGRNRSSPVPGMPGVPGMGRRRSDLMSSMQGPPQNYADFYRMMMGSPRFSRMMMQGRRMPYGGAGGPMPPMQIPLIGPGDFTGGGTGA